jgi:hypothetical protein
MKSIALQRRLTRVLADGGIALELAQIPRVMARIQGALGDIPDAQRAYVANALLNLAVTKMVSEEGMRAARRPGCDRTM